MIILKKEVFTFSHDYYHISAVPKLSCKISHVKTFQRKKGFFFFNFDRPRQPPCLSRATAQTESSVLVITISRLKVKLGPVAAESAPALKTKNNETKKKSDLSAQETKNDKKWQL